MNRRSLLVGVGGVAVGSAVVLGSGAFSSVEAQRTIDVRVGTDSTGFLRLDATGTPSAFIREEDGVILIDMGSDSPGDGLGVNPNAITRIDPAFVIANDGSQDVGISAFLDGATGAEDAIAFNVEDEHAATVDLVSDAPVDFPAGHSSSVGFMIDTTGFDADIVLVESVTFNADANDYGL